MTRSSKASLCYSFVAQKVPYSGKFENTDIPGGAVSQEFLWLVAVYGLFLDKMNGSWPTIETVQTGHGASFFSGTTP